MKRLLTFLIVLGLIGFAGYKGAVWWLVDQRLSEARTALSEQGVLARGNIGSSVDGRVRLEGTTWQDFRLTQPLQLPLLAFDAQSPVPLLTLLLDPQRLPTSWSLIAERASMALEPTMFRNWVTAGADPELAQPPLFLLACAPDTRQQLGSGDLMRMGVSAIQGDLSLAQSPDGLRIDINTVGTGSLEADWPGARVRVQAEEGVVVDGSEPVALTFRDAGLMRRVSAYCARETGQEISQWAAGVVDALEQALLSRGYRPSTQILALYRQWLTEGGELAFALTPGAERLGIPVRESEEATDSWPVRYNGAQVPDLYLTRLEQPEPPPLPEIAVEPAPEDPDQQGWYAEPVDDAANWVGRVVRIRLSNDNQVEGRLVSVGERELEVARTVAGGEVAYPILIRAITEFSVWRRGRSEP
ncbi:MAG: acetylornithine deacetylase [Pseudomonadota bacterium]|nr:acetylornithine deacetylase [Pseudomonadota bacterium]